ncbi:hypothetical protein FA95DRAFT_1678035 [Auriscalpium vulgare]|uniref:Uncharacterized protein n=1 Tax=Auriscalpium vulgare TaxID=40419 RepID=A0ACB8RXS6_9AGAM|nr:hypothetical protein FA95DRAFT_1678035 [Auriscalpium vulgare]
MSAPFSPTTTPSFSPLAQSFSADVHPPLEQTPSGSVATTSTAPPQPDRKPRAHTRLSARAVKYLIDFYNDVNNYPTRREKEHLVKKVKEIDDCEYDMFKLDNWFNSRRSRYPRAQNTMDKKNTASILYPSITEEHMLSINHLLIDTPYPNEQHLAMWANSLGVDSGHLAVYVAQYRADKLGAATYWRSTINSAAEDTTGIHDAERMRRQAAHLPTPAVSPEPEPARRTLENPISTPTSATFSSAVAQNNSTAPQTIPAAHPAVQAMAQQGQAAPVVASVVMREAYQALQHPRPPPTQQQQYAPPPPPHLPQQQQHLPQQQRHAQQYQPPPQAQHLPQHLQHQQVQHVQHMHPQQQQQPLSHQQQQQPALPVHYRQHPVYPPPNIPLRPPAPMPAARPMFVPGPMLQQSRLNVLRLSMRREDSRGMPPPPEPTTSQELAQALAPVEQSGVAFLLAVEERRFASMGITPDMVQRHRQ